ncbi:MAG: hypothetical protein ACON4N_09740 [Myxococcota bacterium]
MKRISEESLAGMSPEDRTRLAKALATWVHRQRKRLQSDDKLRDPADGPRRRGR